MERVKALFEQMKVEAEFFLNEKHVHEKVKGRASIIRQLKPRSKNQKLPEIQFYAILTLHVSLLDLGLCFGRTGRIQSHPH